MNSRVVWIAASLAIVSTLSLETTTGDEAEPDGGVQPIVAGQVWTAAYLEKLNASGIAIFAGNGDTKQLSAYAFEKQFVFPSGLAIQIGYDFTPPTGDGSNHVPDDGVSGGFFDRLNDAAADGNARAAGQLFHALQACDMVPTNEADLAEAKRLTRRAPVVDSEFVLEETLALWDRLYTRCEGVTPEMKVQATAHLRHAAVAGHGISALTYAALIRDTDPNAAEEYYRQLWEAGSMDGIAGLAWIHSAKEPKSYEESVMSFAYSYANLAIQLALEDGLAAEAFGRSRSEYIRDIRNLEVFASPNVIQPGLETAHELIVSNTFCCNFGH